MKTGNLFDAPMPGENFAKDTRGYAWHRPPQYPMFDDAYEYFAEEVLSAPKKLNVYAFMAQNGLSLVGIVQTILIQAVGSGKISPDMSLMLAGPVYKTLGKLMDSIGIEYLTGFDSQETLRIFAEKIKTVQPSKKTIKLTAAQEAEMDRLNEEIQALPPEGGLMGLSSSTETVDIPTEPTNTGLVPKMDEGEE